MLRIPGTVSNVSQTGLSRGEVKANLLLLSIIAGIKIQNIWYTQTLLPHPQWSQPLAASWNPIPKKELSYFKALARGSPRRWAGYASGTHALLWLLCGHPSPTNQACFLVSHPTWLVLIDWCSISHQQLDCPGAYHCKLPHFPKNVKLRRCLMSVEQQELPPVQHSLLDEFLSFFLSVLGLRCFVWASHCSGFSCGGAQVLGPRA